MKDLINENQTNVYLMLLEEHKGLHFSKIKELSKEEFKIEDLKDLAFTSFIRYHNQHKVSFELGGALIS